MEQEKYFARRAFKYDGVPLDRGRVMSLGDFDNDEKLIRLGFLKELKPGMTLYQCGICEAEFISDRQRTQHGNRVHAGEREPEVPVMTKEQGKSVVNRMLNDPNYEPALVPDETISDQEKENETEAPVFMDKTAASIDGGYGVPEVTTSAEVPEPKMATPPPPMAGTSTPQGKPVVHETADFFKAEKPLAGKDLAKWRKKQKLTQKEAAEMLGVAVGSISRAEKLRKKPLGPKLAPALKAALGR